MLEVLSEHQCQGWLEGYLLTGRHGLFNTYEAFTHIVDSMFNQHAKWLKVTRELPWRRPIASLNYLLASHVWRQDHNGFTHQDPGFIDHALQQERRRSSASICRPTRTACLSVMDHCLRSRHYVNIVVAGKHAGAAVARHGRRGPALRGRDRHLGVGEQRRRWRARSRDGCRRATCRRSRSSPPSRSCRTHLPDAQDSGDQRRRSDEAAARERASARPERRRVRRAVHDATSRSSSRITAIRG